MFRSRVCHAPLVNVPPLVPEAFWSSRIARRAPAGRAVEYVAGFRKPSKWRFPKVSGNKKAAPGGRLSFCSRGVMRGYLAYVARAPVRDAAFLAASEVNSSSDTKCAISNLSTMADTDRLSMVAACFASSDTSGDTRIPICVDLFTEINLQCSRLVVDHRLLWW